MTTHRRTPGARLPTFFLAAGARRGSERLCSPGQSDRQIFDKPADWRTADMSGCRWRGFRAPPGPLWSLKRCRLSSIMGTQLHDPAHANLLLLLAAGGRRGYK